MTILCQPATQTTLQTPTTPALKVCSSYSFLQCSADLLLLMVYSNLESLMETTYIRHSGLLAFICHSLKWTAQRLDLVSGSSLLQKSLNCILSALCAAQPVAHCYTCSTLLSAHSGNAAAYKFKVLSSEHAGHHISCWPLGCSRRALCAGPGHQLLQNVWQDL